MVPRDLTRGTKAAITGTSPTRDRASKRIRQAAGLLSIEPALVQYFHTVDELQSALPLTATSLKRH